MFLTSLFSSFKADINVNNISNLEIGDGVQGCT